MADPRPHPRRAGNPVNRWLTPIYRPAIDWVLRWPQGDAGDRGAGLRDDRLAAVARLGGEFMPRLDEGDLLYMPSALPGLSAAKASELLQQTDRMIKTVPEVESVFGKAGRAETATDPAPLEMFETTIQFKPRDQWRPGMTPEKLVEELDRTVKRARPVQCLGAADPQPHRHAGDRHQEPDRRQGHRARSRRARPHRA
jgi:Cu(I)/Ag(I) efflux system membrane protein CusA/SilA